MKNFIQKGDTVDLIPSAPGVSGQLIVVGDLPGVAVNDHVAGALTAVMVEGVFELPKAAVGIAVGQRLYAEAAGLRVTTAEGGGANKPCGYALAAAGSGDSMVIVKFAV